MSSARNSQLSHRFTSALGVVPLALIIAFGVEAQPPPPEHQVLWRSGTGGYHTYRIPVLLTTPRGALLAFAEGRAGGRGDAGDIDLLVQRSSDFGLSWGPVQIVCDDGPHTCGNPAPVIDHHTGTIHLLMTRNLSTDRESDIMDGTSQDVRRVWYTRSTNDGESWTAPVALPDTTRAPSWRWYATGPAAGIQLRHGPHAGRLVVPANHSDSNAEAGPGQYRSHILYSDDAGESWTRGGSLDALTNESTIVELTDGQLMLNARSYHGEQRRAVATSRDGGRSWSAVQLDPALIEPTCQASLIRYRWPGDQNRPGILLFSNPASTTRDHLTVRASLDDGRTWTRGRLLEEGSSAYSSLTRLPDGRIGLLYERAHYEEIVFTAFALEWLLP